MSSVMIAPPEEVAASPEGITAPPKPPSKKRQPTAEKPDYGFRYVWVVNQQGGYDLEEVPLRLIDVIHPEEDDYVAEGMAHEELCHQLGSAVRRQLMDDPDRFATFNLLINFGVYRLRPMAPDVAIISGGPPLGFPELSSLRLDHDNNEIEVALEALSETTRVADFRKLRRYHRAGVKRVIHLDSRAWRGRRHQKEIRDYRRNQTYYDIVNANERHRVWIEPMKLTIAVENDQFVFRDANDQLIPNVVALESHLKAAQAEVEAERARAEGERARAEAAEAELARLRDQLRRSGDVS